MSTEPGIRERVGPQTGEAAVCCTRCGIAVSNRAPSEGWTQVIGMTRTAVAWRLRFRRFRWRWLPENPRDRVKESYTELNLCDWCAGDVFLFAQGLPPRSPVGNGIR